MIRFSNRKEAKLFMTKEKNSLIKKMISELEKIDDDNVTQMYLYIEGIECGVTHSIQISVPSNDEFVEKYRRLQ